MLLLDAYEFLFSGYRLDKLVGRILEINLDHSFLEWLIV
jgi:hypothetical protein